jgi:hypothetical protein
MRALKNPIFISIILISLVIGASTLTRGHEWGDDFASYIMQAQSLLNGSIDEFVEKNTFTVFESSVQIGPVAYPWGYPLILIPPILLKGLHPLALKLPGLFFFAGFLICLYLLTEKRLTRTEGLILLSLFAFNPVLIKHLDYIMTDIPFLFFLYFALLWMTEFRDRERIWNYISLGVILFLAFFIRTTGLILLATYLVYQAFRFFQERDRRRDIVIGSIVVVLTFALLWFFISLVFPSGQSSYIEQLKGLTYAKFLRNIPGYFYLINSFFGAGPAWTFVYCLLVVMFVFGVWSRRRDDVLLLIFFFGYLGAMVFWPEWQGVRFMFPILPLFVYFAIQGIRFLILKLPENFQRVGMGISYAFWLVMIGIFLFISGARAFSNLREERKINGPFDPYSSEMFAFIREETPKDSVIIFFKPRAMHLFTDRDSIMSIECNRLLLGDYVVLHKTWEYSQFLPKDIGACKLPLEPIFENRRFIVYEVPK